MNDKRAKRLRRQARESSVGLPERRYVESDTGGNVRLKHCTRAVYRELKRAARAGGAS